MLRIDSQVGIAKHLENDLWSGIAQLKSEFSQRISRRAMVKIGGKYSYVLQWFTGPGVTYQSGNRLVDSIGTDYVGRIDAN